MMAITIKSVLAGFLSLLCILLSFQGAIAILRNPRINERRWFMTLFVTSLAWILINTVETFVENTLVQRILFDLEWVCIVLIPAVLLLLSLVLNNFSYMIRLAAWGFTVAMPVSILLGIFALSPDQSFLGQYIQESFILLSPHLLWGLYKSYLLGLVAFGIFYIIRLGWLRDKKCFDECPPIIIVFLIAAVIIFIDQIKIIPEIIAWEWSDFAISAFIVYFVIKLNQIQENDIQLSKLRNTVAAMPTPLFLEPMANRVKPTTVLPQKQLSELEDGFQEEDTGRPLVRALNKITAQTSSYVDTEGVMNIIGEELKALGVLFIFCTLSEDQTMLEVNHASILRTIRKRVERMFGANLSNIKFPVDAWQTLPEVLERKGEGLYSDAIADESREILHHLPKAITNIIFNMVGITEDTVSATLADTLLDGRTVVISFWGNNFRKSDLSTFSRFSAQMVDVYNRALQFEQQRDQAKELERANSLIQALGNVTAHASAAVGTEAVLDALDTELSKLGLQYIFMYTDQERSTALVRKITIKNPVVIKFGEKINEIISKVIHESEKWPAPIKFSVSELQPYYTKDLREFIPVEIYGQNKILIDQALSQMNLNDSTAAIMVPQALSDGRVVLLAVWGDDLLPSDIPTFQVFAGQINSAITKEQLYETRQEQSMDLARSNSLLEALNLVAATVSSSTDVDLIIHSLGDELKKIPLESMILTMKQGTNAGQIRYHSIESAILRRAEKFSGHRLEEQIFQLDQWRKTFGVVINERKAVFSSDFREHAINFMSSYVSRNIARQSLRTVNVSENTRGFFLPLFMKDELFGILIVWGETLKEMDLPTFSIFSRQISIAFDNAQMLRTQIVQANRLLHSNNLLEALSQLSFPIASWVNLESITNITKNEFLSLGLNFAYLELDVIENKVTVQYITMSEGEMDFIKKATRLLVDGKSFQLQNDPTDGLKAIIDNDVLFVERFSQYAVDRISLNNRQVLLKILDLANLNQDTSGIMVPIHRDSENRDLMIVWGENLSEEDVNAFRLFKQQVESIIEINRLYFLAETEIKERRALQQEYQGLFENAHDAIVISDLSTYQIMDANERALDMFGYSRDEFLQLRMDEITEDVEKLAQLIQVSQQNNTPRNIELLQYRKNATDPMSMEINTSVVSYHGKLALQSIHRDVTERKSLEKQLRYDSLHDALTGLPNRTYFMEQLELAIVRSERKKVFDFSVLFFDLDRFKDINDSLGHLAGDELLRKLAGEMNNIVRENDAIARMGGDEFAILVQDVKRPSEVEAYCQKILKAIHQPCEISGAEVLVSASIGVSHGNENITNAEDYLRNADIALYRAKADGRNRFSIFDISMLHSIMGRLEIENSLRKAIEQDEFFLTYQPVVDLQHDELVGFEVLLRWRHGTHGIISPTEFIPVAEDIRIINRIGYWVLEKTCQQIQKWQQVYPGTKALRMNVNLSTVQLMRPEFPDEVARVMDTYSISPDQIAFEITETAFIADKLAASEQINILKKMGIQIYLDDYGTGYASLSLINLIKVDALKIDRQFIIHMDENNQREMVRTIIALGNNVGLKVVAEGVETESHSNFLKEAGCGFGQGYHFAQPLVADDAVLLVAKASSDKFAQLSQE